MLVFSGATAVLAVHVAVDSFIAPEPGTAPGDHVVGGAASLAVLTFAAVVTRGFPKGGRGALATVLGALALEGAALAVADARAVGPRGEDWTGFLLCPIGVLLVASATTLLWRSRKAGRHRYVLRAGITVAAFLAAYWLVVPIAIAILATHRPRADVAPAKLGRPYEEVTIRTSDGLDLAAWYVPSLNGAAIISYPTRQGKLPQARLLVRHGYGVLLLDARGYDGSEGDPNLFGWTGAKDIDAAVAWLEGTARRHRRRHRRDRLLGRRRDDAPGRRLQHPAPRRRLGGCGGALGPRGHHPWAARLVGTPRIRSADSGGRGLERDWSATLADDLVPRISPRPLLLVYAGRGGDGEELNPDYHRAALAPKRALDDPRRKPRGWLPGASACVRGARDELLRPSTTRTEATGLMASPTVTGIDLYLAPARCRRSFSTPQREDLRSGHRVARPDEIAATSTTRRSRCTYPKDAT